MKRSLQSLVNGDLDQALDFIAERAVIGRDRRAFLEKQAEGPMDWLGTNVVDPIAQRFKQNVMPNMSEEASNALGWGLGGALAGAGVGGVSTLLQKKKRPLSSILSGALLGGTLGGAGSLIHDYSPRVFGGGLSQPEHDARLQEMRDKLDTWRKTDPVLRASPGLTGAANKIQLPEREVYDAIQTVRNLRGDPAGYGPLADRILEHNWQQIVGKDAEGKPIYQDWGKDKQTIINNLAKRFGDVDADKTVTNYPRLKQLADAGGTAQAKWNSGDYTGAIGTGANVLGLNNMLSLGGATKNTEGIWKDTQRLLGPSIGGGVHLTPDVKSLFQDVDSAKGLNQWGIDPAEALHAVSGGPQAREALWNRVQGHLRYEPGTTEQGGKAWQPVAWTGGDRQKFDELLNQVAQKGGQWQLPGHIPTTGNSYRDLMLGMGGADIVGSPIAGFLKNRRALQDPKWLTKALDTGKFKELPELADYLKGVRQTQGDEGLRAILQSKTPIRYGGTTISPDKIQEIASNIGGVSQPDLSSLRQNLNDEMTRAATGQSRYDMGQLKLIERELSKIETMGNPQQQQVRLNEVFGSGNKGLASPGGALNESGAASKWHELSQLSQGNRHPMEGIWNPTNASGMVQLKRQMAGMTPEQQRTFVKPMLGDIEAQINNLPKPARGQPTPTVNVRVPNTKEMVQLTPEQAKYFLEYSQPSTVEGSSLANLAGRTRPGSAVSVAELADTIRKGGAIPGASEAESALLRQIAHSSNPGELEALLTQMRSPGAAAQTFGETTGSLGTVRNAIGEAVREVPQTLPFYRRGWAGTPIPRWAAYGAPAVAAELALNYDRPIGNFNQMMYNDPRFHDLMQQRGYTP